MNMRVNSLDDGLSIQTVELLNRVKRSRGALTLKHIEALSKDVERLGRSSFLEAASTHLNPITTDTDLTTNDLQPSLRELKNLQKNSSLRARTFVDSVLTAATGVKADFPTLAANNRSLPKLLVHFRRYSSEDELFETAKLVAKPHTRT